MTKIMLVEDDKSLREIYGVRLLAEGYDIVSAGDGEEALAIAIKERPQLIISDVMMPKVSGYDMLDILRSTTETKNIRVIMMTALSSEEQRQRAESLGADRYLVKSQVGIEDVVRVVHEVLQDTPDTIKSSAAEAPQAAAASPGIVPPPATVPLPRPASPQPAPSSSMPDIPKPIGDAPKPASLKTRIIQPLNDPSVSPVNMNELLDKELAKEAGIADSERPVVESTDSEKNQLAADLKAFSPPELTPVAAPEPPVAPVQPATPSVLPTPGISTDTPAPVPAPETAPIATPAPVAAMPPLPTTEPTKQPSLTPPTTPVTPQPAPKPPVSIPVTQVTSDSPVPAPAIPPDLVPVPTAPVPPQPASTPTTQQPAAPTPTLPEVPKV